jgi:hypothetical protein
MEKIVMIEKRDGFKYIVGAGKYPADSIEYNEEEKRYYVKYGKNVIRIDSDVVVSEEKRAVDNSNKQFPGDY